MHNRDIANVVYCATNTVNGKRYVGITTKKLSYRWKEHLYSAQWRPATPFHFALLKYGEDAFTLEVLEVCAVADLEERECYWIEQLNTMTPRGYNRTLGGGGNCGMVVSDETRRRHRIAVLGKKHTPEMRAKMRAIAFSRGPEHINKIRQALTGKHHSEETKAKLRVARAKQVFTPEQIARRSAKLRGIKRSPETLARLSAYWKGREKSSEQRVKIRDTLRGLTPQQAAIIKFDVWGISQAEYARRFSISPQTVNGIRKGRQYANVTRDDIPTE